MLDRNSQIVYLNAEKRSETPVNTDNLAIAKILEMFVEEYDQEEKTSSLTLRKISKKFGGVIDEQTIIKLINLLNSNSGKQILIPYKTIKIPDDKMYFSLLSPEYEDAYYTEFSLSLLKSLINNKFLIFSYKSKIILLKSTPLTDAISLKFSIVSFFKSTNLCSFNNSN